MATNVEAELPKLFSQLQLAGEDGDYDWGLEVSEKILKIVPDDQDAFLCRMVSLIQLSEYEDALKAIGHLSKVKGKGSYRYEKAYCEYKLEKYRQSLETLSSLSSEERSSLKVLDLTAQIYYRLEMYEESTREYRKGRNIQDSPERSVNMVAALSFCSPDTVSSCLAECPVNEETMEVCFNLATAFLQLYPVENHLDKAVSLLQKAEKYCEEIIASDEDSEREMIPIQIQHAYALQIQGQHDKASSLYTAVLRQKPSSIVHTITSANNVIVLNRDKDIFDSKKKIKVISNEQGIKKLNTRQQTVIFFNRCLFALQINQLEQCRQLLQAFKTIFPKAEEVILVEAGLLCREKKFLESCEVIEHYILSNPSCSIPVYLMLAQIYLSQANFPKVCEVLEKVPEVQRYLGIVSILVSLYTSVGADEKSKKLLDDVISYWKSNKVAPASVTEGIFWILGKYELQRNNPEGAANVFEYLYTRDKSNVKVLANLISAYSRFNPQKAEQLRLQLAQSAQTTFSAVDVDNLEQMPSFRHTRRQVMKSETTKKENQGGTVAAVKKGRKKRKPKLPKNCDPSKPPDPERWLPLRERSYYRKSKKKGQQSGIGRGTQGLSAASATLSAKLDASKPKSDEIKENTSSPKSRVMPQQHKKKKKGGRR